MKAAWVIIASLVGLVFLLRNVGLKSKVAVPGSAPVPGLVGDKNPFNRIFPVTLTDLYQRHGEYSGLDPDLLHAVAVVESNENPNAVNSTDPSIGLMQVLCVPDGKGSCKNRLNVQGWPPSSKDQLFDPDYNLHIASQILAWNINTYGLEKGIAVYNSWSAHTAPSEGPFPNQSYVNKVIAKWNEITSWGEARSPSTYA